MFGYSYLKLRIFLFHRDGDGFILQVSEAALRAELSPVSRLFKSSERCLSHIGQEAVNPD